VDIAITRAIPRAGLYLSLVPAGPGAQTALRLPRHNASVCAFATAAAAPNTLALCP